VDAAEDHSFAGLDAMTDHRAAAMGTTLRYGMDRAFEAVEGHGAIALDDFESLVIVVAALIASGYGLAGLSSEGGNAITNSDASSRFPLIAAGLI
jgi:hypothetical protein